MRTAFRVFSGHKSPDSQSGRLAFGRKSGRISACHPQDMRQQISVTRSKFNTELGRVHVETPDHSIQTDRSVQSLQQGHGERSRERGRSGLKSRSGKIILALTAFMLVQHGVRHLLLADDPFKDGDTGSPLLLDTAHPFPSLPPRTHSTAPDQTPVQATVSVSSGQIVAIGSLDRSIRIHEISLKVRSKAAASGTTADQMWFDFSEILLKGVKRTKLQALDRIERQDSQVQPTLPVAGRGKQPTTETTRRFQLPFFRQGNVYQRTLIRKLIHSDDWITIYGDSTNSKHLAIANAIQSCGIESVLEFVSRSIGPISDVDGDGRLALVLGRLADSVTDESDQEPIRGCVRPADFQIGRPGSTDVIYLDPQHLSAKELQSLLAHEFAHAATFSLLVESGQTPTAMPSWLNEAIAHHIEQQVAPHSDNLLHRRLRYNTATWRYPSVISEEFTGMELRRGPSRIASMELLQSTLTSSSPEHLKRLITGRGDGVNRLLTASQTDFPKLFRRFTQHLLQRQNSLRSVYDPKDAYPNTTTQETQPAFHLNQPSDQSIQIRGTSVAISSPATADCELVIETTRDALPQITLVQLPLTE